MCMQREWMSEQEREREREHYSLVSIAGQLDSFFLLFDPQNNAHTMNEREEEKKYFFLIFHAIETFIRHHYELHFILILHAFFLDSFLVIFFF